MRRLTPIFTANDKEKQMNVPDILKNALQTSAAVEVMNEVVLAKLDEAEGLFDVE